MKLLTAKEKNEGDRQNRVRHHYDCHQALDSCDEVTQVLRGTDVVQLHKIDDVRRKLSGAKEDEEGDKRDSKAPFAH